MCGSWIFNRIQAWIYDLINIHEPSLLSAVPGYAGRQSGWHAGGARWHLRGRSLQRATPESISADWRQAGPEWNGRSSKRRGGVKRRWSRGTRGGASHCRGTARRRSQSWGWFTLRWRTDREKKTRQNALLFLIRWSRD